MLGEEVQKPLVEPVDWRSLRKVVLAVFVAESSQGNGTVLAKRWANAPSQVARDDNAGDIRI